MDRRTLLAFLLLTMVLVLYQVFTSQQSPRQEPPPQEATGATAEESTSPPEPEPIPDIRSALPPVADDGAGFVNTLVDTATAQAPYSIDARTYKAVLTPQGAAIRSWILSEYTDAREQPADLVADEGRGLFAIRLIRPEGTIDLSDTEFATSTGREDGAPTATFEARSATGVEVHLRYRFSPEGYTADLQVTIDGVPNERGDASLELAFPGGLAPLERNPQLDRSGGAGMALLGNSLVKHGLGRGDKGWEKAEAGVVRWAGVRSKYFLLAAIPADSPDGQVRMERVSGEDRIRTAIRLPLGLSGTTRYDFRIFAGPMTIPALEAQGAELERAVDLGWKVLRPFTRLLLRFFRAVHTVLPNYGVVIIVLSVLTKVLFYPLTKKSMESMKQMQLLKPEIDRINEKFKDDPQRRNQAMLDLYKKRKINPMGGCLPLLVQMPVFIALFNVLNSSIELRKEPFLLWMNDLSTPDKVGTIVGFPIHILPLVMAATMLIQQKLTPTDPRQAAMAYLMPIIMTVFFYNMPSGLVLYWTVNNVMQVGQQLWMNRTTQHQLKAA